MSNEEKAADATSSLLKNFWTTSARLNALVNGYELYREDDYGWERVSLDACYRFEAGEYIFTHYEYKLVVGAPMMPKHKGYNFTNAKDLRDMMGDLRKWRIIGQETWYDIEA